MLLLDFIKKIFGFSKGGSHCIDEVYLTNNDKMNAVVKFIVDCYNRKQPVLVATLSSEKSENLSHLLEEAGILHQVLGLNYDVQQAEVIARIWDLGSVTILTNTAAYGAHTFKRPLNSKIEKIKEVGGLCVIGTERSKDRNIDNQIQNYVTQDDGLGILKFFLSLEDDLMRDFGTDQLADMLVKLGHKEGEALTHPFIHKAIERAQKKVQKQDEKEKRLLN